MKKNPVFLIHGIINVCIHIPALLCTSFLGMLIIGLFDLAHVTNPFLDIVLLLPLFIPAISCVLGIIFGAVFLKREKFAKICLWLSLLGIFLYAGMICACGWLGSVA